MTMARQPRVTGNRARWRSVVAGPLLARLRHRITAGELPADDRATEPGRRLGLGTNIHRAGAWRSVAGASIGVALMVVPVVLSDPLAHFRSYDPQYYLDRGLVYQRKGLSDFAAADFVLSLQRDPKQPKAYAALGSLELARNRFDVAVRNLNAAIALDPTNAAYYRMRGQALESMGALERALADYQAAIRLDPAN